MSLYFHSILWSSYVLPSIQMSSVTWWIHSHFIFDFHRVRICEYFSSLLLNDTRSFFYVHHSSKLTLCVFILSGFLSLSILYQWNILTFCSHWFWKSARFQFQQSIDHSNFFRLFWLFQDTHAISSGWYSNSSVDFRSVKQ